MEPSRRTGGGGALLPGRGAPDPGLLSIMRPPLARGWSRPRATMRSSVRSARGGQAGAGGARMNEPTAGSEAGGREPPGGGSAGRDTRARRQGAPERSAGPGRDPTAPRGGGAGRAEPRGQWEGARPPPLVPFPPSSCAAPAPETPAPGLCGPSPTRPGRRRAAARRDANGPAPARAAAARPRACKSRFPEPAHARRGSEETRGTQANLSSGWVPTF